MTKQIIVFSAPSGSEKNTIIDAAEKDFPNLEFPISATNRPPRKGEENGRDYYFLTTEEFRDKIEKGDFVEWEEAYSGRLYGTLKSELERIRKSGHIAIKDLDVKGSINIKKIFGD